MDLRKAWVVEAHADGAVHVVPVMDMLARNYTGFMEVGLCGYVPLGFYPTMESACEGKRLLMQRRREKRAAAGMEQVDGQHDGEGADGGVPGPGAIEQGASAGAGDGSGG